LKAAVEKVAFVGQLMGSDFEATGMKAKRRRRDVVAVWKGKPLKSESWRWLRGEINSQGRSWRKSSKA